MVVLRWPVSDAVIATGVAGAALAASMAGIGPSSPGDTPPGPLGILLAATLAGALVFRRLIPVTALVLTNTVTVVWFLVGLHGRLVTLGPLIALYTIAALRGWRWGAVGGLLTVATTAAMAGSVFEAGWPADPFLNAVSLEIASIALGAAVHYHRGYVADAAQREDRAAEARAEQVRRRAAEQRLEIAREVHDVVGHTLATVSVQAGVAIHVMRVRPEQAAAALTTIKQISDEGLAEVRVLLGMMRGGRVTDWLARFDGLLEVTRAAGIAVDVQVNGSPPASLPAQTELAVFRVVQESLTNVRRHAHASRVRVGMRYQSDSLVLTIHDNGTGDGTGDSIPGGGHGIAGMTARATALGGTLLAGPHPAGGYQVRCTLPVSEGVRCPNQSTC